jgi:hypothetical protein
MSFTWTIGLLIGAALLFAIYAGVTRRKPPS